MIPGLAKDVLAVAAGGVLFYLCSGEDWDELVDAFSPTVDIFWFCDPTYGRICAVPVPSFRLVDTVVEGDPDARTCRVADGGRGYQDVPPCVWSSRMVSEENGRMVTVKRRRGFGEYALATEFPDRSISVFVHRGDTLAGGESSSSSCFLGRRRKCHEPLSMLFDKLARKLRDTALIVSDGSNTDIAELRVFHRSETPGSDAFAVAKERPFSRWGFDWHCVGHLGRRYGPTLLWEVRRSPDG
ncbi:hypothetical protein [Methylobacterium radiodurans]|uniref:Uncharacterized protein n=1 Tax=Methylobacterium radiodurans TaxID=2202828 RepID=A0A2U8VLF5_9HYPH|nr:hypothetical protein [Methylobacterium radiodurans]AWN34397.1 hypothetical protein DK427_00425 [Methylobacterium radiodurans]